MYRVEIDFKVRRIFFEEQWILDGKILKGKKILCHAHKRKRMKNTLVCLSGGKALGIHISLSCAFFYEHGKLF
jgi:hypothetical protein